MTEIFAVRRNVPGILLQLAPRPITQGPDHQLFSSIVKDLDSDSPPMWAVGGMEWLALQVVWKVRHLLQNEDSSLHCDPAWTAIEGALQHKPSVMVAFRELTAQSSETRPRHPGSNF